MKNSTKDDVLAGIKWIPQGEANHYILLLENNWVAQIHLNGEFTVQQQEEMLNAMLRPSLQLPKIGEYWPEQGGIYAGVMRGENGKPDYHLILATTTPSEKLQWSEEYTEIEGADHEFDGLENTRALIASGQTVPAAAWCTQLSDGGHNDFYLPSRRECALLYASCPDHLDQNSWHWTSTQHSVGRAWSQYFEYGYQLITRKGDQRAVRAVRRILI